MPLSLYQDNSRQSGRLFLVFYASVDDDSGRMWCPDCLDVEDHVNKNFENASVEGRIIYVGQKSEWKNPHNYFRTSYNIQSIPTILRYTDGKEDGRLVLGEILESGKLERFIQG